MDIPALLMLFAAGLTGGTAAGLFGIGGGVIYVFVYNLYFDQHIGELTGSDTIVHLTILNAACSIFVAACVGSFRQMRYRNFYPGRVLLTGLPSGIAAFLVTAGLTRLPGYNQQTFLLIFTIALLPLLFKFLPHNPSTPTRDVAWYHFPYAGGIAGAGSALSGLGGGFLLNPILHGLLGLPVKKTFSISLGSMMFTAPGIILYHVLFNGNYFSSVSIPNFHGIAYPVLLPVLTGVLAGTPIGIRLHHRWSEVRLRTLFFLLALAIVVRNLIRIF